MCDSFNQPLGWIWFAERSVIWLSISIDPWMNRSVGYWYWDGWLTGLEGCGAGGNMDRETFYVDSMRSFCKSPNRKEKTNRFTGGLFHVSQLPGRAPSQVLTERIDILKGFFQDSSKILLGFFQDSSRILFAVPSGCSPILIWLAKDLKWMRLEWEIRKDWSVSYHSIEWLN